MRNRARWWSLIPWGISLTVAVLVLSLFGGLYLYDQVFWKHYYSGVVLWGDRCRGGVGSWPGSFAAALEIAVDSRPMPMPHRGSENPPRAFDGQFMRVDCEVPLNSVTDGSYAWISLGQLYGGSRVLWNGRVMADAPSGQLVEFPVPPSDNASRPITGEITILSRGMADGSVGMATLRPPYLSTRSESARAVQRLSSSVYSEQPVFRAGIAGAALLLFAALWWFGMRYTDILWVMALAGFVCVAGVAQYALPFGFSWKPTLERVLSVANFGAILAQAMFIWTFARLGRRSSAVSVSLVVVFAVATVVAATASDVVFFDWRLLVLGPTRAGIAALLVVIVGLMLRSRDPAIVREQRARIRWALGLAAVTLATLATQAWLDESRGIYVHYQTQLLAILLFSAMLVRDTARRQREYFIERDRRVAEENKNTRAKAIADTARFVAHDLRRPFTYVGMFLERVAKANPDDVGKLVASFHPSLVTAESEAKQLIDDLMSFGDGAPMDMVDFAIADVAAEVIADAINKPLSSGPGESSSMTASHSVAGDIRVMGDRRAMKRVLHNIVHNAMQAMDGRGRIEISAATLRSETPRCRIVVFNTGTFIAPESRERVFELGFTSGKQDGKGLGLAYARKVIEQHQGSIMCESDASGTRFIIEMPMLARSIAERPMRVALVDDDLFVHMAWTMDQPDLRVSAHHDPEAFVAGLERDPPTLSDYDVIIMDYRFHGVARTGLDFARSLRVLPGCPPIFLATQASLPREEWLPVIDALIGKRPIGPAAIRAMLGKRRDS